MDDKTMLELAAKAAGAVWVGHYNRWELNGKSWWPLEDDGDALRLAVKLHLTVRVCPRINAAYATKEPSKPPYSGRIEEVEACRGDPHTAMRLAIVRAAAEIGKGMGVGE